MKPTLDAQVIADILAERINQQTKWSKEDDDKHTLANWEKIIAYYLGCGHQMGFRHKMVVVGALAIAALEAYDRAHGWQQTRNK